MNQAKLDKLVSQIEELLESCAAIAHDYAMAIDTLEYPEEAEESIELLHEFQKRIDEVQQNLASQSDEEEG